MKKPVSYRFNSVSFFRLVTLSKYFGVSQTELLEAAINFLFDLYFCGLDQRASILYLERLIQYLKDHKDLDIEE